MLVNQPVPNLFGGVSQQPPLARFINQLDEQVNFIADPVEGLRKRPPTEHVARLAEAAPSARPAVFPIDRDPDNRFIAVVSNGIVRVFDIRDGSEKTVTNAGRSYLQTDTPATSLRALTVADYTFIVNREVAAGTTQETAPIRPNEALLWVRASAYGRTYTVTITGKNGGGTRWAIFKTPDGDQPAHAQAIDTASIATNLRTQLQTVGTLDNVTLQQVGSVIYIQTDEPVNITVEDGQGGQALRAYAGEVQRFSDLPERASEGVVLKVVGDQSAAFDDYWVRFNGAAWEETAAPGSLVEIDPATMPVALVRQPDDTFDLVELPWVRRKVGDEENNPFPSFVGRRIRGMFIFRNRLGFLADENAYFSAAGDFFNLFRTTVTQLRDTDPIDLQAGDSSGESSPVSLLEHAVSFDKRLVLFARNAQFVAGADGPAFTPSTAFIEPATRFQASAECRPVAAGRYVYFAFDRDGASGVRELFVEGATRSEDAMEVTAHCPTYIPPGVVRMTGSTLENVILAISRDRPNEVYVYNYFWSGEEKLQSAWSRWEFDPETVIYSIDFFDNVAYLVVGRPDGLFLERMRFRPRLTDEGLEYFTLLDSRFEPQPGDMVYDPVFERTEITLPYEGSENLEAVTLRHPSALHAPGLRTTPSPLAGNTVLIPGDVTYQKLVIGRPYTAWLSPTRPYVTQQSPGGDSVAATEVRLKVRSYSFDFARTGYFRAVFQPRFRGEAVKVYSGITLGQDPLSEPRIDDGKFSIKTPTENTHWGLTVINDSPFPSAFLAASWMGLAESKSRRV